MKILFVCTGNTCRSPMAEGILRNIAEKQGFNMEIKSAGIAAYNGSSAAINSIEAMKNIDIDISNHKSSQLSKDLLEKSDLILTMSDSHKEVIISSFPSYSDKVLNLLEYSYGRDEDIKDPFGSSLEVYEETRDEIYEAILEIIKKL